MFSSEDRITRYSSFPLAGEIRCAIVKRDSAAGHQILTVRTVGVESGGNDVFDVDASQIVSVTE